MLDSKLLVGSIKNELFDQLSTSINQRFDVGEDSFFQQWQEQASKSLSTIMKQQDITPLRFPADVSMSTLISQGFSIAQILKLGGKEPEQRKPISKPVKTEAISEEVSEPVKREEAIPRPAEKATVQGRPTVRSSQRRPRYDDGTLVAGARSDIGSQQWEVDLLNSQLLE